MVDVPTTPALKDPSGIKTLEEMRDWAGDVYQQLQSLDPNATLPTVPGGGPGAPGAFDFNDAVHGARSGGSLHALVVAAGAAGFFSGGDKTVFDLLQLLSEVWNGAVIGTPEPSVSVVGANWTLSLAGGLLKCVFDGVSYDFDCTTPQTLGLTAGTDASPIHTFVWLKLTGSTVSLDSGTDWPTVPYCPIALTLLQAASSPADIDGPFSMHAWTDHIKDLFTGHGAHITENIRNRAARWLDGCAASVTIASGSVLIDTEVGRVRQLHLHTMRVVDMGASDPIRIVNQPVSEGGANDRLTNLDDLTTDAAGTSLNGKHCVFFLFGTVSQDTADDKVWLNLPIGVHNTQAKALLDLEKTVVTEIPPRFIGIGFPIAKLVMQVNLGGTWVLHELIDLRKSDPSGGGSGGSGIQSHSDLPNLLADDHPQYPLKTLWNAQSILVAIANNTPVVQAVAASRFVGRKATGDVGTMDAAEALAVLGISGGGDGAEIGRVPYAIISYSLSGVATKTIRVATTVGPTDSMAGQKVLGVQHTADLLIAGQPIVINAGGAREEFHVIASVNAGVSITLIDNLIYNH